MPNFEIQRVEKFDTQKPIFKLIRNGKCSYDSFISSIKEDKNLNPELGDIYAILKHVADNATPFLPKQKYRKLKLSNKIKYAGYEAKSKHLRLYLFVDKDTGMILVLGGKKGDQDEDIESLERIIKEYSQNKPQSNAQQK